MNAAADNLDHHARARALRNADNRLMLAILVALAVVTAAMGAWVYFASHGPDADLRRLLVQDRRNLAVIYKAMRAQLNPPEGTPPTTVATAPSPATAAATQPTLAATLDQFVDIPIPLPPPAPPIVLKSEHFKSAADPDQSPPHLAVNPDPRTGHRFGDYWFTYAGLETMIKTGRGDAAKAIIAVSAPHLQTARGRSLLYADGSVISLSNDELTETLTEQNKLRAKWELPPLDVEQIVGRP